MSRPQVWRDEMVVSQLQLLSRRGGPGDDQDDLLLSRPLRTGTLIRLLNTGAGTPALTNVLRRIDTLLGGVQVERAANVS